MSVQEASGIKTSVIFTSLEHVLQNFFISVNFPFQLKTKSSIIIDSFSKQWTGDFRAQSILTVPSLSFPGTPVE